MRAVPLTAVTLEAVRWQVLKLQDLGEDKRPTKLAQGGGVGRGVLPCIDSPLSARVVTKPPCGRHWNGTPLRGSLRPAGEIPTLRCR